MDMAYVSCCGLRHIPLKNSPSLALRAIRFVSTGHFVNPSRASPTVITVREISSGAVSHSRRFHAYVESSPAIFVSAIFSELSKMREPTQHGLPQNMLQGKFHTQEWDRFVAFMCMVFGKRELNANVARDSMHFVTRALSPDGASGKLKTFLRNPSRLIFMLQAERNQACSVIHGARPSSVLGKRRYWQTISP
jgi:hypothetical protein